MGNWSKDQESCASTSWWNVCWEDQRPGRRDKEACQEATRNQDVKNRKDQQKRSQSLQSHASWKQNQLNIVPSCAKRTPLSEIITNGGVNEGDRREEEQQAKTVIIWIISIFQSQRRTVGLQKAIKGNHFCFIIPARTVLRVK